MKAKEFLDSLVPGNYFLTKSMELTKVNSSGTLWYTKKFLVLYNYIFLQNNIVVTDTVREICDIFDYYIESMPRSLQKDAREYFYSDQPVANLKDEHFRLFDDFVGCKKFDSFKEKQRFYFMAQKYYFAFLMESGGQSGVNGYIKSEMYKPDFQFVDIDNIINEYYDYNQDINITQKKNDYMAFIRNERQILFYYGFYHSKTNGSTDLEFSSLTPVGELAIESNYYEFIAIWEHQKIKMLSQPVTVDIQNIPMHSKLFNPDNFTINFDPYLTIIEALHTHNILTSDQYKYVVSRLPVPLEKKDDFINEEILKKSKKIVKSWKRERDIKNEDFSKELKKYMLGVRGDLAKDKGENPMAFCEVDGQMKVEVTDLKKLSFYRQIVFNLSLYKSKKYMDLFKSCKNELKRQYECKYNDTNYIIDPKVKINWDMYNIHQDIAILLSVMSVLICFQNGKYSLNNTLTLVQTKIQEIFPTLIRKLGLESKDIRNKVLQELKNAHETRDFIKFIETPAINYHLTTNEYLQQLTQDLEHKIKEQSTLPSSYIDGVRKRNTNLIQLMKAYNISNYAKDNTLQCECCGQPTFITYKDEPYLEYHHIIPFSQYDGVDHYLNIVALCPMCHRKIHYIKYEEKDKLYLNISKNNFRKITIKKRLIELKKINKLKSYQLEFLLTDNAIDQEMYDEIIKCA